MIVQGKVFLIPRSSFRVSKNHFQVTKDSTSTTPLPVDTEQYANACNDSPMHAQDQCIETETAIGPAQGHVEAPEEPTAPSNQSLPPSLITPSLPLAPTTAKTLSLIRPLPTTSITWPQEVEAQPISTTPPHPRLPLAIAHHYSLATSSPKYPQTTSSWLTTMITPAVAAAAEGKKRGQTHPRR